MSETKKYQDGGLLSIGRWSNGVFTVSIEGRNMLPRIEATLTAKDFAEAVTGLAAVPCRYVYFQKKARTKRAKK